MTLITTREEFYTYYFLKYGPLNASHSSLAVLPKKHPFLRVFLVAHVYALIYLTAPSPESPFCKIWAICDPVQQKGHLDSQVYSEIMSKTVCKI